jgi:homoserine dehydrogenase
VLVTHTATDAALAGTVDQLAGMEFVRRVASVMRVEGMHPDQEN